MSDNLTRALVLLVGAGFAIGLVVFVVVWAVGVNLFVALVAGLVVGALAGWGLSRASVPLVLWLSGARPADPAEHARLANLLEGLCLATGLRLPDAYVVPTDALNAFAASRGTRHAVIVVTEGLLGQLTRIELEAVLAHLLSRIKRDDARLEAVAAVIVGLPLSLFPGLRPRALRAVIGGQRALQADLDGVAVTRYPPGLLSALQKLRDDEAQVRCRTSATIHLWIDEPTEGSPTGRVHMPLDDRIAVIQEL